MSLDIQENISLKNLSTMRVGGQARYFLKINDKNQIPDAIKWAKSRNLPVLAVGAGSNVVFKDEGYPGLVMTIRNKGIQIIKQDTDSVVLEASAGENWDDLVAFSVDKNLSGIEALTAVPGTVGGAPIQNIGCYGQELSDTFIKLEAYDLKTGQFVTLDKGACQFRYRDSIFKSSHPQTEKGRYIITLISLKLSKTPTLKKPLYESLQRFMDKEGIEGTDPKSIRQALLEWRSIYLPDPSEIPSNGSFFRNPIIPKSQFDKLKTEFPGIKGWLLDDSKPHHRDYENNSEPMVKVAAAWLVDQTTQEHMPNSKLRLHDKQKLVVTNPNGEANYQELIQFVYQIIELVEQKFGVKLVPEPEFIP